MEPAEGRVVRESDQSVRLRIGWHGMLAVQARLSMSIPIDSLIWVYFITSRAIVVLLVERVDSNLRVSYLENYTIIHDKNYSTNCICKVLPQTAPRCEENQSSLLYLQSLCVFPQSSGTSEIRLI